MKDADIILSDNSHQSSFTLFGLTVGNSVLAANPFCRELESVRCSLMCFS
jgi:hypothetical protein